MVERPDEDASPAEIARWTEKNFVEALAEGVEQVVEDDDSDEQTGIWCVVLHGAPSNRDSPA